MATTKMYVTKFNFICKLFIWYYDKDITIITVRRHIKGLNLLLLITLSQGGFCMFQRHINKRGKPSLSRKASTASNGLPIPVKTVEYKSKVNNWLMECLACKKQ